jgi:hypothetical protein
VGELRGLLGAGAARVERVDAVEPVA